MAIRNVREVARSAGFAPAGGQTIIAGQPLVLASATTVKIVDSANDYPYVVAAESTTIPAFAPANGLVAGEGLNYTDFDRGGLVSGYYFGSELDLFDDGRGAPFTTGDTYVLNRAVYVDPSNGKITSNSNSGANKQVGTVVDFEGASPVTRLRVKFSV